MPVKAVGEVPHPTVIDEKHAGFQCAACQSTEFIVVVEKAEPNYLHCIICANEDCRAVYLPPMK